MSLILGLLFGGLLGVSGTFLWLKNHDYDPEAAPGWFTVVGVWPESKERFSFFVQADDARQAEDLTQWEAQHKGGELWVTGVFDGKLDNVDGYAKFVDPDAKATDWTNTEHGKI